MKIRRRKKRKKVKKKKHCFFACVQFVRARTKWKNPGASQKNNARSNAGGRQTNSTDKPIIQALFQPRVIIYAARVSEKKLQLV